DVVLDCGVDTNRMRCQFFMSLRDQTRRIVQCIRRRSERIQGAQGIFGQSPVDMCCSLTEIFASDLFNLDESLRRFTRLEVFSDPFSSNIVASDLESGLSTRTLTHYFQRVRSLAFCSYGDDWQFHALKIAYLAISGNKGITKFDGFI